MNKPLVAVIGRPNVGKSTFFNKICGKRISIVKDTPGVTRDRIYADAEWCGRYFTLIDTGGIYYGVTKGQGSGVRNEGENNGQGKSDNDYGVNVFASEVKRQAEIAAQLSDVIVFLVDGKAGLTADDATIANYLRRAQKPVILAVNKLDNFEMQLTYDFYELGLGEPFPISCEQGKGLGELLDEIVKDFVRLPDEESTALKIAVTGKPNVGKSSLVNKILGYNRVIVSDVAGTTRDAIDTPFERGGKNFVLIDTAGLRRKRAIDDESVERYSVIRAIGAVKRADVVLCVIDASDEISEQDIKVAALSHEEGKPTIIVVNKWDKVEKDTFTIEEYRKKLDADLAFMGYYESIFVSAATGQRVDKIFGLIEKVYENNSRRITTGMLNDVVRDAVAISPPPSFSGKRLKILYATQPQTNPPKFVIFVSNPKLLHFSYQRYLENQLRRAFDFSGTPIVLSFVKRE
ncbi:MAG: ribosome biogenesis GTPase Der [Firmicutes bacterium]|nr:ribosome biogenesis GTPase Der [Bacillota bacterium]